MTGVRFHFSPVRQVQRDRQGEDNETRPSTEIRDILAALPGAIQAVRQGLPVTLQERYAGPIVV